MNTDDESENTLLLIRVFIGAPSVAKYSSPFEMVTKPMPVIPLYTIPAVPDGYHRVISPGGYEAWLFEAADPASHLHMRAVFGYGSRYHPKYEKDFNRYMKRPTRIAPPMPADYPIVQFVLHRAGRQIAEFLTEYSAGDFAASVDKLHVRIGPNEAIAREDHSIHLELHGDHITANFEFHPIRFSPTFNVQGTIQLSTSTKPQTIAFAGAGGKEHIFSAVG